MDNKFDVYIKNIKVVEKINNLVVVEVVYKVFSSENREIFYKLGRDVGILEELGDIRYNIKWDDVVGKNDGDGVYMNLINDNIYRIVENFIREL